MTVQQPNITEQDIAEVCVQRALNHYGLDGAIACLLELRMQDHFRAVSIDPRAPNAQNVRDAQALIDVGTNMMADAATLMARASQLLAARAEVVTGPVSR